MYVVSTVCTITVLYVSTYVCDLCKWFAQLSLVCCAVILLFKYTVLHLIIDHIRNYGYTTWLATYVHICRGLYMFTTWCTYISSPGEDKYQKITNVSIIVLGIYTCGISVLLWALYKGLCSTREKYTCSMEGMYICYSTSIMYKRIYKLAEYCKLLFCT